MTKVIRLPQIPFCLLMSNWAIIPFMTVFFSSLITSQISQLKTLLKSNQVATYVLRGHKHPLQKSRWYDWLLQKKGRNDLFSSLSSDNWWIYVFHLYPSIRLSVWKPRPHMGTTCVRHQVGVRLTWLSLWSCYLHRRPHLRYWQLRLLCLNEAQFNL